MFNNRMKVKSATNSAPRFVDMPEGVIPARVIMPDGSPMRYDDGPAYNTTDPGYNDDPNYDDYIADRIFRMRDIEHEQYTPAVNELGSLLRSVDTMFMHELDNIRRQEMATAVEYNTQRNIMLFQQMVDSIDDINRRLTNIEKAL